MRIRRKDETAAEPTGDTLTLEREGEAELGPFSETEAGAAMPAFEAPPVDTAPTKGRLGHVLVSRGVVTESQVAAALKAQADSVASDSARCSSTSARWTTGDWPKRWRTSSACR